MRWFAKRWRRRRTKARTSGSAPPPSAAPSTAAPTGFCASDRGFAFALALDGDLEFHWTLEGDKVRGALVLAGGGWAALGWGDGDMVGTECVLSVGGDIPKKYELTSYSTSGVDAMAAQTLEDASTTADGAKTVIAFTKLLEEPGESTVGADLFVWAHGPGALGYHGRRFGVLSLDLATCASSAKKTERVRDRAVRAHGALMLVAFAACLPLALVAARAKDLAGAWWLRMHIVLNVAAVVLGVIGAAVLAAALDDADKDHLRNRHSKVGVGVLALAGANLGLGFARPAKDARARPAFYYLHAGSGAAVLAGGPPPPPQAPPPGPREPVRGPAEEGGVLHDLVEQRVDDGARELLFEGIPKRRLDGRGDFLGHVPRDGIALLLERARLHGVEAAALRGGLELLEAGVDSDVHELRREAERGLLELTLDQCSQRRLGAVAQKEARDARGRHQRRHRAPARPRGPERERGRERAEGEEGLHDDGLDL
mmetsp:Transcript_14649/g.43770  ORF Transcript_14649/g.43770 Transcript_14649/m.43770 type:complete len:484 (+) Transcript_14649:236-1687(+)